MSEIDVFDLPLNLDPAAGHPVPDFLLNHPWMIYHGTPLANCHEIERDGILPERSNLFRATIEKIVKIFESMRWYGLQADGFATLATFCQSDFKRGAHAGVAFFACSFERSLRYCHPLNGGSEKARAICLAYEDLRSFLNDKEIRDKYDREKDATINTLQLRGAHEISVAPHRFRFNNLSWLKDQLDDLKDQYHAARRLLAQDGGAVYLLKMTKADVPHFKDGASMGIYTTRPVPVDRIIGKVLIRKDQKLPFPITGRSREVAREEGFASLLEQSEV